VRPERARPAAKAPDLDVKLVRPTGIHGVLRIGPAAMVALATAILSPMGCGVPASDRLVVATSWPLEDLRRLEAEFAEWVASTGRPIAPGPVRLDWLILEPGDDPTRVVGRRNPPDVLLGGPTSSFDRLARMGRLLALPLEGSPSWAVSRRATIRLTGLPSPRPRSEPPTEGGVSAVPFDDPRNDPISLGWAKSLLDGGHFLQGYSRLVRQAGQPRRIGRQAGTAPAAVSRSQAEPAPSARPGAIGRDPEAVEGSPARSFTWIEGVAIPREARHPGLARAFLRFLAATGRAGPAPAHAANSPDAEALLADLLGATLVDAQDELWVAWSALKRGDHPESALRWMTEPPPWPPASVAKMLRGQGEHAMPLLETLVGQLATDPSVRAWLLRSWLSPPHLVDEALLHELALAAEGRLCRESRFRDWLRAEWTAWARQRYRRVERLARGPWSVVRGPLWGP
jgi:hypothetical protein